MTPNRPALLAALALAALVLPARAGEEELRRDVKHLASDELEGRATASRGGALAADYVEKRLQEAGASTRRQRFGFLAGVKVGEGTRLVTTLRRGGKVVDAYTEPHDGKGFRPLGFSANGDAVGEVVFAGFGIHAPEAGFDDYAGVDVAGKVLLILDRTPQFANGASPLAQDAALRFGQVRYKVMTAREKGAAGVLVVSSDPAASKEADPSLLPLTGGAFQGDAGIVAADLSRRIAVETLARAGLALDEVQREIERSGTPRSCAVEGLTVSLTVDLVKERKEAENVIALLPGSDPTLSEEAIVVGAHMDHLGRGEVGGSLAESAAGKEIHNGADDNASGTAALLEVARTLPPLRRTVVLVAFSGEEMGLLGSAHYVKEPLVPLARTAAMVNMDMVGRLGKRKLTVGGMGTAEEWKALVPACAKKAGIEIAPENDGYGPSDHSSFYGKGVPVLFLFTGAHADYHRPSDDWDKVDTAGLARIAGFARDLVVAIDALPARPRHVAAAGNPHGGDLEPGRGPSVYLGTIPDYSETERPGVALTGVREGSPAAAAGLKAGDVIVSFDGHEVRNVQDYTYALFAKKPGDKVDIVVERGEGREKLTLTAVMGRKGGKAPEPPAAHGKEHELPPGHPPTRELPPGHPPVEPEKKKPPEKKAVLF